MKIQFSHPKLIKLFIEYLSLLILLIVIIIPSKIYAVDGQIDILPDGTNTYIISKSGSYVLVDNITMKTDVDCIKITAINVTIDMNGHCITGRGNGSSDAVGIKSEHHKTKITNGRIESFGADGIIVKDYSHIDNILATFNGNWGISAGKNASINNSIFSDNNKNGDCGGIKVGNFSIISGCIANNNSTTTNGKFAYGIIATNSCNIHHNTANLNTSTFSSAMNQSVGIFAESDNIIESNTCNYNEGTIAAGILVGNGNNIHNNTCNYTKAYHAHGISCADSNLITGNTCCYNDGSMFSYGIKCAVKNKIDSNILNSNSSSGTFIGILATDFCSISNNECSSNIGLTTSSNIQAIKLEGGGSSILFNKLSNHKNSGTNFTGYGIYIVSQNSTTSIIEGNICIGNDNGIRLNQGKAQIISNRVTDNLKSGIMIETSGNYYSGNIAHNPSNYAIAADNTEGNVPAPNMSY